MQSSLAYLLAHPIENEAFEQSESLSLKQLGFLGPVAPYTKIQRESQLGIHIGVD